MSSHEPTAPPQRRIQFKLSSLLVVATIICLVLAYFYYQRRPWTLLEIPLKETPPTELLSDVLKINGVVTVEFKRRKLIVESRSPWVIDDVFEAIRDHGLEASSASILYARSQSKLYEARETREYRLAE